MQRETPYVSLRKLFRKNNAEAKELTRYIFEKSDSITMWIIGLSFGSMGVLVATLKDINKYLSTGEVKTVFLFLFLGALFGILYRIFYLWYYTLMDVALRHTDYRLSEDQHMDIDSDLDGEETFKELIRLNSQFEDLTHLKALYDDGDEEIRTLLYNDMVTFYKTNTAWAKKMFDLTIELVADIYNENLGLNKKHFDLNRKPSFNRMAIAKWGCFVLYLAFMFSFLFAFGYFMYVVKIPTN